MTEQWAQQLSCQQQSSSHSSSQLITFTIFLGIVPYIFLFTFNWLMFYSDAQRLDNVRPHTGSTEGATRLTLTGEGKPHHPPPSQVWHCNTSFTVNVAFCLFICPQKGFAQEGQFQLNPQNDTFGNRVTLVSDTLSIPCDVERDSTHGNQIMCYTRYRPQQQQNKMRVYKLNQGGSAVESWLAHLPCSYAARRSNLAARSPLCECIFFLPQLLCFLILILKYIYGYQWKTFTHLVARM